MPPLTLERPDVREQEQQQVDLDVPWMVRVWNDPVNLMSYVTYVFETHFGLPRVEAQRLMWMVHTEGSAVVAIGNREPMEMHVIAMHGFGLQATMAKGG